MEEFFILFAHGHTNTHTMGGAKRRKNLPCAGFIWLYWHSAYHRGTFNCPSWPQQFQLHKHVKTCWIPEHQKSTLSNQTLLLTCSERWWVLRQAGCRSSLCGGRRGRGWGTLVLRGQATPWTGTDEPPASHSSHSGNNKARQGWIWWWSFVWSHWPTHFLCVTTKINTNKVFP